MINKKSALKSTLCSVSLSMLAMSAQAMVVDADTASTTNQPQASLASKNNVAKQVIVKFKANSPLSQGYASKKAIEQAASASMGMKLELLRTMSTGAFVMRVMPSASQRTASLSTVMNTAMSSAQGADSPIEMVQEDRMLTIQATPNDTQYTDQWHYYEATGGLNVPGAWDTTTGSGVVVAVIDTGITSHPDLNANMLPGYDMISSATIANDGNGRDSNPSDTGDDVQANECFPGSRASTSSWHGTHVAGTVSAIGNNALGVAGVAYDSKVVPIRALGRCGGRTSDIADGIIWAAGGSVPGVPNNPNPAQVINLSLGGEGACDATSQAAINRAVQLGATVVVAAGNSAENASNATPANCQNVVTVAATGRTGGRASYSNFGNVVDVAAPGGDQNAGSRSDGVLSTLNNGRSAPSQPIYEYYQGTSMATPHVAGVAALMYAVKSDITPAEVESLLKSTSRSFPASCSGCGTGIVDAAAVIEQLAPSGPTPPADNALTNGVAKTGLVGALNSETRFTLEVPAGATNLSFRMSGGTGDADLYVRFGAEPTTSTYDCRPFLNGNNETCTISNIQAGTYNVMLRGYTAFSGVSLVANFDAPANDSGPQSASANNISGTRNQWTDYTWEVTEGRSSLEVKISGGSGDADLYVRRGANPTTSTYDCRPFLQGNNETCTISNPAAGTYFIRLRGFTNFSGVNLEATQR